MIDRLARVLAAIFPEMDGEHLADALWLAATCGGNAKNASEPDATGEESSPADVTTPRSVTKTKAPDGDPGLALPSGSPSTTGPGSTGVTEVGLKIAMTSPPTLTAAAALSLFRRVHRPGPPIIDIDATVEATADAQRLVVVTRPARAKGLDVAIVVDHTPVALAWADAITELEGTLRRTGAFRTVTRWSLDHSTRIGSLPEPVIRDSAGAAHRAGHIVDPAGRRLVLLLTDGAAESWRQAGIWRVLRQWALSMPTALIHLLPESYWGYTAIGQPSTIIRSRRPAGPNSTLEVRTAWWSDEEESRTGVPVPLVEFTPDSIAQWTRAVVTGNTWTEAIWTHLPQTAGRKAEGDPTDWVLAFQTRASGGAQRLAQILAGAPVLSLPLIRILHQHLIPQPSTGQLAELLISGLLEKLPADLGNGNLMLRFRPGVADLLYQGTTTTQEWDIFELLSRYLERNAGPGHAVRAVLASPTGTTAAQGGLIPFAAMGQRMALRLGLVSETDIISPSISHDSSGRIGDTSRGNTSRRDMKRTGTPHIDTTMIVGEIPSEPAGYIHPGAVEKLNREMESGRRPVICAISGLGGTGKSQVAAAYARQRIEDGWSLIGWVNAETPDKMLEDLAAIADALGVQDPKRNDEISARNLVNHLNNRTQPGLIVFDNAIDSNRIRTFLPTSGGTQILITTTNPELSEMATSGMYLSSLSTDESIQYLRKQTNLDDDEGAALVAETLKYLPSEISRAAATIRRRGWSYQKYLDYLRTGALDLARHEQALTNREQALGPDHPDTLQSRNDLASAYEAAGRLNGAITLYERTFTDRERILGPDHPDTLTTRYDLAAAYEAAGRLGEAVSLYQQNLGDDFRDAPSIHQDIGDRGGEASNLNDMGRVHESRGEYAAALDYYQQALTAVGTVGNQTGEAAILSNIGRLHDLNGEYDSALGYYQRATTLHQVLGDRAAEANILNNIGQVHSRRGSLDSALIYYQQALSIYREIGDRDGEATTLNNLGYCYSRLGRIEGAIERHQQALTIYREIGDRDGEATTLANLGYCYSRLGRTERAIERHQQALTIYREIGDRDGEASSLNNIGQVHHSGGDIGTALDYYQKALDIYRGIGDPVGEASSLNNIGQGHNSRGDYESALDYYQKALIIQQEIGDRDGEAVTRFNLATAFRASGRLAEAVAELEVVVALNRATGHPDLTSDTALLKQVRSELAESSQ